MTALTAVCINKGDEDLTENEAIELIERMPYITTLIIANDKVRLEVFQDSLQSKDPVEWVKLIKTDYIRRNDKSARKLPSPAEREIAAQAKQLLYADLGVALNIPQNEVEAFIVKHIEETSW